MSNGCSSLWLATPWWVSIPRESRCRAWPHPLGTDDLGRDALVRLLLAATRSLGFASACALLSLGLGLGLAWWGRRLERALSALRVRLDTFRQSPAWAAERCLGATWASRLRRWGPYAWTRAAALFPSAWLSALWGEATLSTLAWGRPPATTAWAAS